MPIPFDFSGTAGQTLQAYDAGFALANSTTGSMAITAAGRLRRNATTSCNYTYATELPPSADYWVEADFFFETTTRSERFGITGRNSTSALTFYLARVATTGLNTANVQLWKWVNGTPTQLPAGNPTNYQITISGDPTYRIRLRMQGSAIAVDVDGVERISATDASITAAGRVGFYGSPDTETFGDTLGMHLDNFNTSFAAAEANASGAPATITVTAPTGSASADGAPVEATGSPPQVSVTAPTGAASSGLPLTLLWNFAGANASNAGTVITGAETATPTVDLVMRNPEGGAALWQHFLFGLQNPDAVAKTVTIDVDLTAKEGGTGILSTWSGPYQAPNMTDHTAWTPIARSAAGGVLTFTVTVPGNSSVYISSMPPNTDGQIMSRIAALEAAFPSMIHDDVDSRIAENAGPYIVDIAPTVTDDLGRSISGKPMRGFRVGNDAVGTPKQKRRVLFFANRHPGEHHGTFQLFGALWEWLTSTDPLVVAARDVIEIWVYPAHAVNGIEAGYRRHEPRVGFAQGDDINREWRTNSQNHIAVQWINLLKVDHGNDFGRVEMVIDFHDLAYSTQLLVYYYRTETPNLAALRAVIDAEFTDELPLSTSNTDTATDYFVNTVGTLAFTAEVSDEATSLAGFEAVGAGWARIVSKWNDANLIGTDPANASGEPASVTVSAPTGSASADGAPANASGAPAGVTVAAPSGAASASAEASGAPASVSMAAPEGSASAGPAPTEANGEPAAVTLSAPTGAVSAGATASGTPATITVAAPTGLASDGTVVAIPNPERMFAPFPDYSTMVA